MVRKDEKCGVKHGFFLKKYKKIAHLGGECAKNSIFLIQNFSL
jgi:hypothetical protein